MKEVISEILAPVILISACGLLCLAQFARYTAIQSRIRGFSGERLSLLRELKGECNWVELAQSRLLHLENQGDRLLRHLHMIRYALACLVMCIVAMTCCSLSLAAALLFEPMRWVAGGCFILGLVVLLMGMALVLVEVGISMNIIRSEHEEIKTLSADYLDSVSAG